MLAILLIVLAVFALLNFIAWNQAAGMTTLRSTVRRLEGLPGFLRMALCGMRVLRPVLSDTPANHHMPYSDHRFPSTDGLQLHAWHVPAADGAVVATTEAGATGAAGAIDGGAGGGQQACGGKGRALIVSFNWFGGAKCALLPHIGQFHREGWDVFAVDLRGHGGSDGSRTSLGWHEARDVLAALAYARRVFAPERIVLHGVSLGAVAALRAFHLCELNAGLCAGMGRVAGLLLESPFDRLYHTVRHRVATFGVPECVPLAALMLFWGGVQLRYPPFCHDPYRYARSVDAPVLILHGGDDAFIREAEARRVAENVPGGNGALVVIERQPHGTALFDHPEAWKAAALPFLREVFQRESGGASEWVPVR